MKFGYDFNSKYTFVYNNKEIKFLGKKEPKDIGLEDSYSGGVFFDDQTKEVYNIDDNFSYMIGAYYLSAFVEKRALIIFSDGISTVSFFLIDTKKDIQFIPINLSSYNSEDHTLPIIVCGSICNNSYKVAEVSNEFKFPISMKYSSKGVSKLPRKSIR